MNHTSPLRHERIEFICRALVARFADALNKRDPIALAAALAPDLFWETAYAQPLRNPAEVARGFMDLWARDEGKDLWLDVDIARTCRIEVEGPHRARGSTWVVMYGGVHPHRARADMTLNRPEMIGCCRQLFVCTPHGWRIAEHRATAIFRSTSAMLRVPQSKESAVRLARHQEVQYAQEVGS